MGRKRGLLGFLFLSLYDLFARSVQHSGFRIAGFLTCRLRASEAHISREIEPGRSDIAFYDLGTSASFPLLKNKSLKPPHIHWKRDQTTF